jgi:hypothetical protein
VFAPACLEAMLCLHVLAAPAPPPRALQWRFKEGDVFYHQTETSTRGSTTVMGAKIDQNQTGTTLARYTVRRKNADGSVVLEYRILSVKQHVDPGGIALDFLGGVKGQALRFTLSARGEVVAVDGYQKFIDAVVKGDESKKLLVAFLFSEDALKQQVTDTFAFPAGKSLAVGEVWKRELREPMGPMGEFKGERTFRFAGRGTGAGRKLDRITWTATARYLPPKGGVPGVPFKVDSASFDVQELQGTVLFDPAAGRSVEATSSFRLRGTMKITVGEQPTEVGLEQATQRKSRILTSPPPGAK